MKVKFLGTAADQIPSPYCGCSVCNHAREHRGRNIRNRCSYLINDDLLVDMGPDLSAACSKFGVHLKHLNYALITHSHRDHFDMANLVGRKSGYQEEGESQLTFVAPPSVMTMLTQSGVRDEELKLIRKPILPNDYIHLDPYYITAIKANHDSSLGDVVNYLIDDGKSKILIAHDTGIYNENVWPLLENLHLDKLVIECTKGVNTNNKTTENNHLSISGVKEMIQKMNKIGTITEKTSVIATHFSHRYCLSHENLSATLRKYNFECAYDGMVIDF